MPTEAQFLGVYGAVWLAILLVAASAVFARRMLQLLRVLALGQKENRLEQPAAAGSDLRQGSDLPVAVSQGRADHQVGPPLDLLGLLLLRDRLGAAVRRRRAAPWLRIPQAEAIPVLGTVIDLFAVAVLVGLIASSIRRYVFTPPGLQRTIDATIVVSLIAALMVTYLMAEAGGYVKERAERNATTAATLPFTRTQMEDCIGHRAECLLPSQREKGVIAGARPGCRRARPWPRPSRPPACKTRRSVSLGVGAWWAHALILCSSWSTCPTRSTCT